MNLSRNIIDGMFGHAIEAYPDECCGIITGDRNDQFIHRCNNVQNRLHAEDPLSYPRDARTAYVIDRSEFDSIISASREKNQMIIALYHSHTDHEAYFSVTDTEAQTVLGEPEFPGAVHIVISVMGGRVHDIRGYRWEQDRKEFVQVEVTGSAP